MSKLPPAWEQVPLASITGDASQRVPSADEQITYIDIGSLDRDSKTIMAPQRLLGADAPSRARKQVRSGDTIVSMTRPNLNAVALVPPTLDGQIASTGFDVLRPFEGIDPRWIAYLVRTESFVEAMTSAVQGALYPAVRSKDVRAYRVPLAPLAEQTRIADQLDTLLARIQACNDRIDAIPALLKRFRQAVLDAAVSGELTGEWSHTRHEAEPHLIQKGKKDNSLPHGWRWSCAEEIKAIEPYSLAIGPFGSNLKVSDYTLSGVPLVFVREIRSRDFSSKKSKFISQKKAANLVAHSIEGGDLLITKMGDPPGDVAVYPLNAPPAVITADCIKLRVNASCAIAEFVGYVIESTSTRTRLREITAGVAQQKISLARFRHFPLPLAPIEEQAEIVRRVEALFKLADRIEARYTAARAQAQRLTPLLLAKAFRGELVPQDPNDEPASILLERIRGTLAEHSVKPKARTRRAAQPKAEVIMLKPNQIAHDHLTAILRRQTGLRLEAKDLWRESQLDIPDFYEQLKREADEGLLREAKQDTRSFLEAA